MSVRAAAAKLLGEEDLVAALAAHRAAGRRIVFLNGGFDVLHVGHVRALTAARAHGDVLVVGVNADASVRLHKGPGRPLVPEAERVEVLAALAVVDHVVVFADATVDRLLERLRPDVHAKGRDYTAATLPERATNERLGIEMVFVGDAKAHASRSLIARAASLAVAPPDRVRRLSAAGLEGFVLRERSRVLVEGGWTALAPWVRDKPGAFVEGHERRFVRRLEIDGATLYAKVTRPLQRRRSPILEMQNHLALRVAGFRAPEPWLALEGTVDGERVGLLLTRALDGPSLLDWLRARPAAAARRLCATDLGRALRALHTARFLFPDAVAWHTVLTGPPGGGASSIGWLDLMRVRRGGRLVRRRTVARDLTALDLSVRDLVTDRERLRCLRAYLGGTLVHARPWLRTIATWRGRLSGRSTFCAPPPGTA